MRVLVVGAGAVGSFLGWAVAAGGGEVTLVRRGSPASDRTDLRLIRPDGTESVVRVRVVPSAETVRDGTAAGPPDLVILATRQHDLVGALADLAVLPATPVLTAQNGVGAEDAARAARPEGSLLAASVTASVEREADGTVRWLRRGGVGLARVRGGPGDPLRELVATLRSAEVAVSLHANADAMKWSKLVANLVGNATSGLLDLDPGTIYRNPALFALEREQLREALRVMRTRRLRPVDLPGAPVRLLALATVLPAPLARAVLGRVVGSARGGKDPSLRGAVRLGGPTEVPWLNGAVARAGAEAGVATPVNAALARLVEEAALDPARRTWFERRPDRLLAELGRTGDPVAP